VPAPSRSSRRRNPRRLASITAGADYANVCRRTIYNWVQAGRLTGYRTGPKLIKVDLDAIDALIRPVTVASNGR
jgi:excisionase family DNA binding protein